METILKIFFSMFAAFVLFKICHPQLSHFISIYEDIADGRFVHRKWHKHAVVGVALGVLLVLLVLNLKSPPHGVIVFLLAFGIGSLLCYVWEALQGLLGANRTSAEVFEMRKDIIVGSFFVMLGALATTLICLL